MVNFPVPEKFNTFNTFNTFDPIASCHSSPPAAWRRDGKDEKKLIADSR
jgi:hypothetical protein